jgi:hypothetical protein
MVGQLFLRFPCPPTPNKPDINPDHLVLLKTLSPKYSTLVSTSKIFFGCSEVLGVFPASNNKTLKLSLFFHPHSTYFHHFHLSNEDHDKPKDNGNNESIFAGAASPRVLGLITQWSEGNKGLYWELPRDKSSLPTGETTILFATTALPDGGT